MKSFIRSTVDCSGLRARVARELFAAAAWKGYATAEERSAALAYWQARNRAANAMYYRLFQFEVRVPTRNQLGARKHENRNCSGSWTASAEYRDEQRQMGFSAL